MKLKARNTLVVLIAVASAAVGGFMLFAFFNTSDPNCYTCLRCESTKAVGRQYKYWVMNRGFVCTSSVDRIWYESSTFSNCQHNWEIGAIPK